METREDPTAETAGMVETKEVPEQTPADGGAPGMDDTAIEIPAELNLLPLREHVLFPAVVAPLTVQREALVKLVNDAAVGNNRIIGVVTQRDPSTEQPGPDEIYHIGTAAAIRMMVNMPDGARLIVQGLKRIRIEEVI